MELIWHKIADGDYPEKDGRYLVWAKDWLGHKILYLQWGNFLVEDKDIVVDEETGIETIMQHPYWYRDTDLDPYQDEPLNDADDIMPEFWAEVPTPEGNE
jgi:hypothetical protein